MTVRKLFPFMALLLWSVSLLAVRMVWTRSVLGYGLFLNLFLATIPLVAAITYSWASSRRKVVFSTLSFVVWLLFLPNAPYIVTDLVHLAPRPPIPFWYDVMVLASMAGTGVLLGYLSVALVHHSVTRRVGPLAGWSCAVGALFLSGFGIYLGRFLRWNSWDVATRPVKLALDVGTHLSEAASAFDLAAMTAVYGITLCLGYAALHAAFPVPRLAADSCPLPPSFDPG